VRKSRPIAHRLGGWQGGLHAHKAEDAGRALRGVALRHSERASQGDGVPHRLIGGKRAEVQAVESVKNSIKEATAKTLPFSMFGVIWLALGVFLSGQSPELERWVHLLAK
jgi:hypothetical protein